MKRYTQGKLSVLLPSPRMLLLHARVREILPYLRLVVFLGVTLEKLDLVPRMHAVRFLQNGPLTALSPLPNSTNNECHVRLGPSRSYE